MPERPLSAWPRPSVTVDLVILTILDSDLKVLLVRRGRPPFEGQLALPGGFVRVGEDPDAQGEDLIDAARRELAEETGLPEGAVYLEQLGAFGAAGRDPRGRVITVAWYALVRSSLAPLVQAGGDAASAGWRSVSQLEPGALAFDHGEILAASIARVRERLETSHIAFELVPETFTVTELRAVYEVLQGAPQDPANFRRGFKRMLSDGLLEQAPGKRITGARRASVYRFVGAPTPRS
ncbi:MAG: NUDIX hydrolase [Alphaproteobacteria bacterium]|nr:NUDIX hydrolase [Alphaproteobacteria bacterium]